MTSKHGYEMTEEEQELFDKRSVKLSKYVTRAAEARKTMDAAIDEAFDRGSEFGFEMGAMSKETDIINLIDDMFYGLTSSEEDAKLTLQIIKTMILRLDDKNDE